MPRMDGTGPSNSKLLGQGARGNENTQKLGVGCGKGFGKGNGRKMGNGFRHGQNFSSNLQPLTKDELTFLKNKANNMENNLNNVKARISELEQSK